MTKNLTAYKPYTACTSLSPPLSCSGIHPVLRSYLLRSLTVRVVEFLAVLVPDIPSTGRNRRCHYCPIRRPGHDCITQRLNRESLAVRNIDNGSIQVGPINLDPCASQLRQSLLMRMAVVVPRPDGDNGVFGDTAFRKADVVELWLPWWPTFSTSALRFAPDASISCSDSAWASPVSKKEAFPC